MARKKTLLKAGLLVLFAAMFVAILLFAHAVANRTTDNMDAMNERNREDAESAMKDGENLIRERMRDSARSKKRGEVDRWLWR